MSVDVDDLREPLARLKAEVWADRGDLFHYLAFVWVAVLVVALALGLFGG